MEQNLNILDLLRLFRRNTSSSTVRNEKPTEESYDKVIEKLYDITLNQSETLINKEEHNELEIRYKNMIGSNTGHQSIHQSIQLPHFSMCRYNDDGSVSIIRSNNRVHSIVFGTETALAWETIASLFQHLLSDFMETGEKPEPLAEDIFERFKEVPYDELKDHTKIDVHDNCSICLSGFVNNENEENRKALLIPCGHYFHKTCIKKWLTECHYKCPICKQSCDPAKDSQETHTNDEIDDEKDIGEK
jgi:hypothetical protein